MQRSPRVHRLPSLTVLACLAAIGVLGATAYETHRKQDVSRELSRVLDLHPASTQAVQALLDQGADLETRSNAGRTVLMIAAEANDLNLVQRVLASASDLNARDQFGRNAVEYAVEAAHDRDGYRPTVELLVRRGAELQGMTLAFGGPLFTAAANGNSELVHVLTEGGADPNQQNSEGFTPLFLAALHGHVEAVEALLEVGADPTLRARNGHTAAEEVRLAQARKRATLRLTHASPRQLAGTDLQTRALLQLLR